MATAVDLMKGGFSAMSARALHGQHNTSVSAAGTTLATATALVASINSVTTVAASSGVSLPNGEIGDEVFVYNGTGTNPLTVYPAASTHTINQLSAGTGILLNPYTGAFFKRISSTAWLGFLSA